jgi:hypothetical protein
MTAKKMIYPDQRPKNEARADPSAVPEEELSWYGRIKS